VTQSSHVKEAIKARTQIISTAKNRFINRGEGTTHLSSAGTHPNGGSWIEFNGDWILTESNSLSLPTIVAHKVSFYLVV
jgi:hypothetical protein